MSRCYGLMAIATTEFHAMRTYDEKVGAYRMLSLISEQLHHMHFNEKLRMDAKTIVNTLDSIQSNLLEDLIHLISLSPVAPASLLAPPPNPLSL